MQRSKINHRVPVYSSKASDASRSFWRRGRRSCIGYVTPCITAWRVLMGTVQLARALMEHETLTADEVRRVIKGEPIRDLQEKLSVETIPTEDGR